MRIAVAGGTGLVGSRVVDLLRGRGDDVVVLSRSNGVDLMTGAGLDAALEGAEAVVDVTSKPSQSKQELVDFFGRVARALQEAAARAGVRHVVTLSIVGIDQMPDQPHYAGKLAQEAATKAGAVPWTILRATQFHGYGGQLLGWVRKGPVMPCPAMAVQTVDVATVAEHLADLVHEEPRQATIDLAGPKVSSLRERVRAIARARGIRCVVVPVPMPGATGRAMRRGAALGGPDAVVDGPTFEEWLARTGGVE